ncbi:putative 1,3-beta-glucanosyltransferase [Aspergillus neoniger CBS 115656]|uniref:1,3-beta-glucanosyltransferase n=1 Tax=Aspergillus neoniger (strain CBS 115656) TaxID=1448310 RepID=A0A318YES3_ASPNB|nr:1,3-beta-glucanosyltransferase [Aspergillus neoniger CBS 115656]PYH32901.1 1,3-beta-glucanosyltransferase [Aspergillus neoniger CBS 115656]
MVKTHWSSSATALSLLLTTFYAPTASAIQTISAVGSKFFYEDGTQYYIKGIAYQLIPEDPLIDTAQCTRDAARMAELGTNAIRVYHVDPKANHDGCMKAFADAGIYLFVDLDTFDTAISQDDPHWDQSQFDSFKAVLDAFQKYDNTAGVFVGNEVLTTKDGSAAAPYVLAAARDIKSYRNAQHYRSIPVGYSAADIAELRPMLQNYLACRSDPAERLDFFSLNAYEWCGDSSYELSGYQTLQDEAEGYPIPIFFSETGCNVARPRTFSDQAAIFGDHMSGTWSGAMIYEWIEETNDYGLIEYGPPGADTPPTATKDIIVQDGFTRQGEPTPIQPDFDNLKNQWATLDPTGVALSDYVKSTAAISPPECPASTDGGWAVDPSAPLPTIGQAFVHADDDDDNNSGGDDDATSPASATATTTGTASESGADSSKSVSNKQSSPSGTNPSGVAAYSPSSGASSMHAGNGSGFLFRLDVSALFCVVLGGVAWWL